MSMSFLSSTVICLLTSVLNMLGITISERHFGLAPMMEGPT